MAAFTEANVEAVIAHCAANAAALAEPLSRCFGRSYRIEAGESGVWSTNRYSAGVQSPGILALLQIGTQGMAVLISEALPCPAGIKIPTTVRSPVSIRCRWNGR